MNRVKFLEIIYKKCPECLQEITPEWESCFNDEWCPKCGLNIDIVKAEKEKQ